MPPCRDEIVVYLKNKYKDEIDYVLFDETKYMWQTILEYYDANIGKTRQTVNKNYVKTLCSKKSFMYLTLSPDKYLRNLDNTPENVDTLHTWCEKWFAQNKKYYGDYCYVVECGSQGDHLHVHAICELKCSHKHAENLKKFWAKYFPNNQLLTTVDCSTKAYKSGNKRGEY